MNDILRRIQQIESDIKTESFSIKQQYSIFKEIIDWPKVIPFFLLGGFVLGYFLAQKKILLRVISTIAIFSLIINRFYKSIKMLLLIAN